MITGSGSSVTFRPMSCESGEEGATFCSVLLTGGVEGEEDCGLGDGAASGTLLLTGAVSAGFVEDGGIEEGCADGTPSGLLAVGVGEGEDECVSRGVPPQISSVRMTMQSLF